jgi:hypothetical protein
MEQKMQARKTSDDAMTCINDLDTLLASKIKEIIEEQWGKSLTDVKNLRVEQFYERRVMGGQVSYETVS